MKQKGREVDIITMGCSKNLTDSERLLYRFASAGIKIYHNPESLHGDVVVINTCGFIGDAKEESIAMILDCCQAKAEGRLRCVYVMGCLSQRYASELPTEIPEVDGWYGKFDWEGIVRELSADAPATCDSWQRKLTTPGYQAYLKIAEGCNRYCAYCAIPLITGSYKSRPVEEILEEVRHLVKQGVKEFNVIAQDLTYYGKDIYGEQRIAALIDDMANIHGVEWIRLHYAYPTDFPYQLLDVMARHDNICRYLDIALQHINDGVLDKMQRRITAAETRHLLQTMRERVPGIHIRTTLMVGFPGEGEAEFEELCDFVREQRFERMGAFAYCEEDDTFAARHYADEIPQEEKQRRLDKLMRIQEEIALEHNEKKIGETLRVIIDSEGDEYYIGRSEYDSPEVDPEVLVSKDKTLVPGEFYDVEVIGAQPYELIARVK